MQTLVQYLFILLCCSWVYAYPLEKDLNIDCKSHFDDYYCVKGLPLDSLQSQCHNDLDSRNKWLPSEWHQRISEELSSGSECITNIGKIFYKVSGKGNKFGDTPVHGIETVYEGIYHMIELAEKEKRQAICIYLLTNWDQHSLLDLVEPLKAISNKDIIFVEAQYEESMFDYFKHPKNLIASLSCSNGIGKSVSTIVKSLARMFPHTINIAIGEGVGAHAAGFAGRDSRLFDYILGLDPTGLCVPTDPAFHLTKDDAGWVETIHSSASIGAEALLGNIDFFVDNYVPGDPNRAFNLLKEEITKRKTTLNLSNYQQCNKPTAFSTTCEDWGSYLQPLSSTLLYFLEPRIKKESPFPNKSKRHGRYLSRY